MNTGEHWSWNEFTEFIHLSKRCIFHELLECAIRKISIRPVQELKEKSYIFFYRFYLFLFKYFLNRWIKSDTRKGCCVQDLRLYISLRPPFSWNMKVFICSYLGKQNGIPWQKGHSWWWTSAWSGLKWPKARSRLQYRVMANNHI